MPRLTVLSCLFLATQLLIGQSSSLWSSIDESALSRSQQTRQIIPDRFQLFEVDFQRLKSELDPAPLRFSEESTKMSLPIVEFPMPDGTIQSFQMMESHVMHPELSAKYPEIKTFVGVAVHDPSITMHCGYSHKGLHAMVRSAGRHTSYIDTYAVGTVNTYISYYRSDYTHQQPFECHVKAEKSTTDEPTFLNKLEGDCQLRVYELALACTAEYANFHGGTIPDVMAAYATSMTRVNGIYETDVNLTMVLIPNTDQLIFFDPVNDPYTNGNGGTMLGENQATIDNIIGLNNYDIGHVFSTGGGGVASLRSPCTNGRARGVTGQGTPVGDPFWVDYVCHEMGHQFGGNHTQNNDCNRAGPAAVEPGSASTIMGYAGICTPNVQSNSDDHFHAYSITEMSNFITGNGNSCADLMPNGNLPPEILTAASDFTLPISTPFVLTVEASDPDPDNVLSYCWEQMDSEVATMPPLSTNTGGPAFRSNSPITEPSRYFPNLEATINNITPQWEVLPSVSRNMDFRCTVRDNNFGGGCTDEVDFDISFTAQAGPFLVLEPNTSDVTWTFGSSATISWDVANTNNPPVNAEFVDIFLSTDGGFTYPILLAEATPNDGTHDLDVPNQYTDEARIMIKGNNSVFFDISDENFTILAPTFVMNVDPQFTSLCPEKNDSIDLAFEGLVGFEDPITISILDIPEGLTTEIVDNPIVPDANTELIINSTENVEPGQYDITVYAESGEITRTQNITLYIPAPLEPPIVLSPENGAKNINPNNAELTWEFIEDADAYFFEISTDPGFETLTLDTTIFESVLDLDGLNFSTVYYWRVKGINSCEDPPFASISAFQTLRDIQCEIYESNDNFPLPIPPDQSSSIDVFDDEQIVSLKVEIDCAHEWTGDLELALIGPDGTEARLIDRPGVPESQFGCEFDDLQVLLYDTAEATASQLESTCNETFPSINGDFQPITPFSVFTGMQSSGTWRLSVLDLYPSADDGQLNYWSLEICTGTTIGSPLLVDNTILQVPRGKTETLTAESLLVAGEAEAITYSLRTLPANGTINLNATPLAIGQQFTQQDLNTQAVSYTHNGEEGVSDTFQFDIVDEMGRWLPDQTFTITVIENNLVASANVLHLLSCFDASDASIEIITTEGFPPFEYSLNMTVQAESVFENLTEGTYIPKVTDRYGCEFILEEVLIENPDQILVTIEVNSNSISVSTTGTQGEVEYQLDNGEFGQSNTFNNLENGEYLITVQDETGCTASTTVIINVEGLQSTIAISQPITCYDGEDGSLTITPQGGIPPYEFSINEGPYQEESIFENLNAGTYMFTVRDSQGTVVGQTLTLENPPEIVATVEVNFDQIIINASGGTGELNYQLFDGNPQSSNTFEGLENSNYTITVIDENGCSIQLTAEVNVGVLSLQTLLVDPIDCHDNATATVECVVDGGVPPYSYRIVGSPFQDNPIFTNLAAGDYTFRVKDAQSTVFNIQLTIDNPELITGSIDVIDNTITVNASGGTGTLFFSIDGELFQPSNTFMNLSNGEYIILVQDENGCQLSLSAEVIIIPLSGSTEVVKLISCFEGNDGVLSISLTGGIEPYEYSIDGVNFQNDSTFSNLPSGIYTPVVRDQSNQLIELDPISLENPEELTGSVSIFGSELTVSGMGGTGEYTYSIDGMTFQSSGLFMLESEGAYTITIQDSNGCITTLEAAVSLINSIEYEANNVRCFGEDSGSIIILNVEGGLQPFMYSLDGVNYMNEGVFTGLAPNDYQIFIQDSNGFVWEGPFLTLTEPEELTLSTEIVDNTVTVSANGGTPEYEFSIDGGMTWQTEGEFTNLPNDEYTIVVSDANLCLSSTTVIVDFTSNTSDIVTTSSLVLSPNPNPGAFSILLESKDLRTVELQIYNINGQLVFSQNQELVNGQADLKLDLENGQYFLKIADEDYSKVARLVIIR